MICKAPRVSHRLPSCGPPHKRRKNAISTTNCQHNLPSKLKPNFFQKSLEISGRTQRHRFGYDFHLFSHGLQSSQSVPEAPIVWGPPQEKENAISTTYSHHKFISKLKPSCFKNPGKFLVDPRGIDFVMIFIDLPMMFIDFIYFRLIFNDFY